jgi:uncharacterized protein YkwD
MDDARADALTRALTPLRSRRGALASMLGGALGLLGLAETAAKKKKKGKKPKKGKKGNQGNQGNKGRGNNGGGKPPVDPGDGSEAALDPEEAAFFTLLNNHRAANGRSPLGHDGKLGAAAEAHSLDMASNGFFDHVNLAGDDWEDRIIAHGYSPGANAENIAAGNSSAQATFTQWKNSSLHNANMLSSAYTETGIGRAYDPSSAYGWYWTNTFAKPA